MNEEAQTCYNEKVYNGSAHWKPILVLRMQKLKEYEGNGDETVHKEYPSALLVFADRVDQWMGLGSADTW